MIISTLDGVNRDKLSFLAGCCEIHVYTQTLCESSHRVVNTSLKWNGVNLSYRLVQHENDYMSLCGLRWRKNLCINTQNHQHFTCNFQMGGMRMRCTAPYPLEHGGLQGCSDQYFLFGNPRMSNGTWVIYKDWQIA